MKGRISERQRCEYEQSKAYIIAMDRLFGFGLADSYPSDMLYDWRWAWIDENKNEYSPLSEIDYGKIKGIRFWGCKQYGKEIKCCDVLFSETMYYVMNGNHFLEKINVGN